MDSDKYHKSFPSVPPDELRELHKSFLLKSPDELRELHVSAMSFKPEGGVSEKTVTNDFVAAVIGLDVRSVRLFLGLQGWGMCKEVISEAAYDLVFQSNIGVDPSKIAEVLILLVTDRRVNTYDLVRELLQIADEGKASVQSIEAIRLSLRDALC